MAHDWFDPLGLRRIVDSVSTTAAQAMVGRSIDIAERKIQATISAVNEAATGADVGAVVAGHIGLWRVFDVEFAPVQFAGNELDSVNVRASSVRMTNARSPRLTAKTIDIKAVASPAQTAVWIETTATAGNPRLVGGQLIADLPGLDRFGEVVLDPWVEGRTVGVDVRSARIGGRVVSLPKRFHRRFEREIDWLPPRTELVAISFDSAGRVTIEASITGYEIPLDVPKLLADLSTSGPGRAVDVLLGPFE